jgi:hypothetical protein
MKHYRAGGIAGLLRLILRKDILGSTVAIYVHNPSCYRVGQFLDGTLAGLKASILSGTAIVYLFQGDVR